MSFLYSWAKAQRTYLVCRLAERRLYSLTPCLSCLAGYDLSIRNTASLPGGLWGKAPDKRLPHSISSSRPGPKLGEHSAPAQSYITPTTTYTDIRRTQTPLSQLLQTLAPCTEGLWRGGREETTSLFLSLVLGACVTTKHLILFCLLSRSPACFIELWKHASNNTQPTQGKKNLVWKSGRRRRRTGQSLILHGHSLFTLCSA